MKKIVLFIMAVMAFAGMSIAQDVYTVGYYTQSSMKSAAIYKNSTKLWQTSNNSYDYEAYDVNVNKNGTVYMAYENTSLSTAYVRDVSSGSTYLTCGSDTRIYALCSAPTSGTLYSVGYKKIGDVNTAVVWQGSSTTPTQIGNGTYSSYAYGCCMGKLKGSTTDWTISVGIQYTSSSSYKGMVWKYNSPLYDLGANISPRAVAVYDGDIYTVAVDMTDSNCRLVKVFKNDTRVYTLSTTDSYGMDIWVDAGDVYVSGWEGSYLKVWKNGSVLYSTTWSGSANLRAVQANSNGIYYAGYNNGAGKIWKNGSVLYSPSNCDVIYGMFVEEPECGSTDILSLPFNDGFENGNTSWPCWTKIDVDNSMPSEGYHPFWGRWGQSQIGNPSANSFSGDYSASHGWGNNSQTGWLITPHLFLQPGRDATTLTFKSFVTEGSSASVWISTTDNSPSSFSQLSADLGSTGGWRTVSVNLSSYQGEAIYIGFKYSGTNGGVWWIDDVDVTESWSYCSVNDVPFTYSFSNWNTVGTCWYAWDNDMSGDKRCWKYNSTYDCACHPYGQTGVNQMGFLCSPRINLPAGHEYVLKFESKNFSSGTGMHNQVWIKLDETGVPVPGNYTTQIWNDTQFPTSWTEVEVPLTAYAGHNITLNFAYYGTYAHTWYIRNVRVEEATTQYTITANSNNSSWGSVTGGGTYNSGATCTLTATPASGYQFESWKKNGSVVSTNANYSFTVTENATYTAYFSVVPVTYYTINTNVTPTGAGTVTGGGTYPEGASVTLTATNNNGYTFDHWQDGNTQNPRTITVTGNATYTATFTQDNYTITTGSNPPSGGNVTGGGTFHYGETCTLTATPASNYEFAGWQDGNTDNPRSFTVTGNATYTATFNEVGTTYFTVTANVVPSGAGTVSGTGTFESGTVIMLTANANPGYTFDHWNDGSTANPRSVTVNNDLSFTAYFTHNSYTITVNATPAGAGSVSGGGSYYYGDYATLTASAYSGYEFVGWSDGSSENPHQVYVTGNATYTATFSEVGSTYYTVSAYVSPNGAGTVTGTGTFPAGASTTLTATANSGYTFDHWNDGSTQNPRTVTVNNNMSFTAYFNTQEYTITTNVTPAGSGTVTGGGTYAFGATVMLTATPNSGYEFLQWSDGNVQNPRIITVTGNATYTALFSNGTGEVYTLTVTANYPLLGQVFGGGTYPAGSEVEISAYPHSYARFVKWSDGNTENPRTVVVNSDMEFVAEFVATQNYTITVESANPERGQAFGGGSYQEGSEVQIAAVAYTGYMFEKWQDGNTENPRTIIVTGDATYSAYFVENSVVTYNVTLICNTDEGTVSGGGTYIAGTQATIQAFPNQGYVFTKWSDDNADNPRTITVNSDLTLVAFFATGVDENELTNLMVFPNPAKESIRIFGIENNTQVEIYNSLGELVKVVSANPNQEIGIRDLASGLYLIRCGKATMRFVKEQ